MLNPDRCLGGFLRIHLSDLISFTDLDVCKGSLLCLEKMISSVFYVVSDKISFHL